MLEQDISHTKKKINNLKTRQFESFTLCTGSESVHCSVNTVSLSKSIGKNSWELQTWWKKIYNSVHTHKTELAGLIQRCMNVLGYYTICKLQSSTPGVKIISLYSKITSCTMIE